MPGSAFDVTVAQSGGEAIVLVVGEVDVVTARRLHEALLTAVPLAGPDGEVVVDMAGVRFFDCAGTHALTRVACNYETRVVIRNARPIDRRLFATLGLEAVLAIEPEVVP